ncbi:MAG: cell surface protein [Verrucomicrobia bacterium]|jgi:hypothetical protein|nr:cell surface protein [Verrucomicrobiota bacterium]
MKSLWRISILMMLAITLSSAAQAAPLGVKWTYAAEGFYAFDFSVAQDGTVYLGQWHYVHYGVSPSSGGTFYIPSSTNQLIALDPTGQFKWRYDGVGFNPVIRKDGRVLVTGNIGQYNHTGTTVTNLARYIQGINPDGTPWHAFTNGIGCALTADDTALISINANYNDIPSIPNTPSSYGLAKVSFTNASQTVTNHSSHSFEIPLIAPDGGIYCAKTKISTPHTITSSGTSFKPFIGMFYAFDRFGALRWKLTEANVNFSALAICADGSVCLGASTYQENPALTTHQLRVISPDGTVKWTASGTGIFTPAVIDRENNLYVGSDKKLISFDPLGGVRWQTDYPDPFIFSPALTADGTLYAAQDDRLYAIHSVNGNVVWSHHIARVSAPPTIGNDGTVYQLGDNRTLLAFAGTSPPAHSPWPQYRHDAQRTGRAQQLGPVNMGQKVDGKFSLTLLLDPGKTYKVEVSDDLATWTEIGSFSGSIAAQTFLDETSAGKPQRFYRLVVP